MRSVVVVLPASMCAMIPMFRVFSSVNLRGMAQLEKIAVGMGTVVWCLGPALSGLELRLLFSSKKMGPSGPRALLVFTGPVRVVICSRSPSWSVRSGACSHDCSAREARDDYSRGIGAFRGLTRGSDFDLRQAHRAGQPRCL